MLPRITAGCVFLALLLAGPSWADSKPGEVGQPLPEVRLPGSGGAPFSLHDLKGKKVVVAFLSFECPVSTSYLAPLTELARTCRDRGVVVVGICPTAEDSDTLARDTKEYRPGFPVY